MFFWHLGGTTALIRYAFRDEQMDLRLLAVGAVVANLVDTPIGLLFYEDFETTRLVLHSLPFAAVVMVAVLLSTRRGRARKQWMPLAAGLLVHLFLDLMWSEPETLWWPFLGWDFSAGTAATAGDLVAQVLSDWRVWVLEAVGLVYLLVLARRARLNIPATRQRFLRTGRIDVPIDGAPS